MYVHTASRRENVALFVFSKHPPDFANEISMLERVICEAVTSSDLLSGISL